MHPEASAGKYSVAILGKDLTARKGGKILSSTSRIVRKDAHIDVDVVLFLTSKVRENIQPQGRETFSSACSIVRKDAHIEVDVVLFLIG